MNCRKMHVIHHISTYISFFFRSQHQLLNKKLKRNSFIWFLLECEYVRFSFAKYVPEADSPNGDFLNYEIMNYENKMPL